MIIEYFKPTGIKMKKNILQLIAVTASFATCNLMAQTDEFKAELVTDIQLKLDAGLTADSVMYQMPEESYTVYEGEDYLKSTNRGGSTLVHVGYLGVEANGRSSEFEYTSSGNGDIRRSNTGSEQWTDILLELPDGYLLNWIRVWGKDTNAAEDMTWFVDSACYPILSAGSVTFTTIATFSSSGSAGNVSYSTNIGGIALDNSSCSYFVRTRFPVEGTTLSLYKIRAELVPAP